MKMIWKKNPAAEARLVDLWRRHHTSGFIAAELGVTRSAVIGRLSRLGLLRTAEREGINLAGASGVKRVHVAREGAKRAAPARPMTMAPIIVTREPEAAPIGGVSLVDIGPNQCRWVVSMPTTDRRAIFCGAGTGIGQCWCAEHRKIGYTPRSEILERRAR